MGAIFRCLCRRVHGPNLEIGGRCEYMRATKSLNLVVKLKSYAPRMTENMPTVVVGTSAIVLGDGAWFRRHRRVLEGWQPTLKSSMVTLIVGLLVS